MPPFFGFLAKETLLETFYDLIEQDQPALGWIGFGAAVLVGAFFVAYSLTLLWEAFLRPQASDEAAHVHHAPSFVFALPPLALALLGTAIPFMLGPLARLIDPTTSTIADREIHTHLALWHGFTPVLIASLVAIGLGVLLFLGRGQFRGGMNRLPEGLRGLVVFQTLLNGLYRLGGWTARTSQGYTLGTQSAIVVVAALIPLVAAFLQTTPGMLAPDFTQRFDGAELVLALLLMVAAVVTARTEERLGAIISLGVVGVTVTLFYVFYSAPDLALTQLLIEVLTVVLLVLVFHKLHRDVRPAVPRNRQVRVVLVSIAAGLLGFGLVLFNTSPAIQVAAPISQYFLQESVPLGHGANVVNVILVDFRGFDTLGEITVLALSALGGYALLKAPRVRLPTQPKRTADTVLPSKAPSDSQETPSGDAA